MTTCSQCLTELSTMRIGDMRSGTATALHLESCPRCAGIAEEIAYAERRLSIALAETGSSFTPEELSHAALLGSERERRKEVGRWVRGLLAAAGCVTLFLFFENVILPRAQLSEKTRTETITLRCISSEEAMDLATPYLRSSGAIYSRPGSPIVTVRGIPEEFAKAVAVIKSVDDATTCQIPNTSAANSGHATVGAPVTTITSTEILKKD